MSSEEAASDATAAKPESELIARPDGDVPETAGTASRGPAGSMPASEAEATSPDADEEATSPVPDVDLPWVAPVAPPEQIPAPPPQPWRARRIVFIDVENTSSEASVNGVLDELDLDDIGVSTELIAIGNWRVIGQGLARSLAARGAQLVHSAPPARVRDWSDLWIAVHAGIWLGRARAGDTIDLVSHDRAFDAVGDAASRLGVTFRRATYGDRATKAPAAETKPAATESGRRRRGGRGRGRGSSRSTDAAPPPAAETAAETVTSQPARPDEIEIAIARLTADDPSGGITLDQLAEELKSAGFHRPAGSPRLITRLKRLKDVEVLADGRIRLASAAAPADETPPDAQDAAAPSTDPGDTVAGGDEAAPARRSRRRGGRRRGGRSRQGGGEEARDDEESTPPTATGEAAPASPQDAPAGTPPEASAAPPRGTGSAAPDPEAAVPGPAPDAAETRPVPSIPAPAPPGASTPAPASSGTSTPAPASPGPSANTARRLRRPPYPGEPRNG